MFYKQVTPYHTLLEILRCDILSMLVKARVTLACDEIWGITLQKLLNPPPK